MYTTTVLYTLITVLYQLILFINAKLICDLIFHNMWRKLSETYIIHIYIFETIRQFNKTHLYDIKNVHCNHKS